MTKKLIIFVMLLCSAYSFAQEISRKGFGTPFDFPLYLSGNFGELRSNHFHGGLDFKTQYRSGKRLLALADGYISKLSVTHGSGYVVYAVYDNGFTTISRHLMGFVSPLAQMIDSLQYANQSWEVNMNFKPHEIRIKKGQHIAWSGNMGYSFGPHLHLDVLETSTGDYIDPMPFFSNKLKDTTPPRAQSYAFFPRRGEGVINGSTEILIQNREVNHPISAWGWIGVGIKAFDYMDGVHNNYGVKTMRLYVDEELVFSSYVDRFSASENRAINSWAYKKHMKAFKEPGAKLRMLSAHNNSNGWININKNKIYNLRFELVDYFNNASSYYLKIKGEEQEVPAVDLQKYTFLPWNRSHYISEKGLNLYLPSNSLYQDLYLEVCAKPMREETLSFVYELSDLIDYTPLHIPGNLSLRVVNAQKVNENKLYMGQLNKKGEWDSLGGVVLNGFMNAEIKELGTFAVLLDTIPPKVEAVQKKKWVQNREIVFSVEDRESGIASYKGTIDGEYALFYLDIVPKKIRYKLDSKRLQKGKQHKVHLEVVDNCKNRTFIEEEFYW